MSKTSSVYRNLKRVKMVAKYANIRSKLKAIADDKNAPEEEISGEFEIGGVTAQFFKGQSKKPLQNYGTLS